MSGIELQSQFNVQIAKPLDLRAVVADTTARNAIDSAVRYKGMTVYVIGESKFYYLKDGILDTDWTEFSFGSGSGGVKNYFTDPKFDAKTDAAVVYNDYDEPFELDYVSSDADFSNNIFKPGDGVVMIHSFETGDQVRYDIPSGGELLPGLTDGQVYYVIDADVDNHTFKLSETKDGDAVDISAPANATSLSFTEVVYYQGTVGTEDATHLAVSINTTDPQSGLGSLEIDYTYSATTSALGEGVRISTNKIDVQDQGKAQYVYLWFDFSDANYTSGDMKFKLWDKTNSKEIDLEGLGIDTKIYNDARAYNFVFVPPSSTREYYFSLHSVDDNATASWKGKCGTFTMTPQGTVPGAIITPWSSYTPTITGFGTPTSVKFKSRQVGSSVEIMGTFTPDTTTATEGRVSLPTGLTTASDLPTLQTVGVISAAVTGTSTSNDLAVLAEASKGYLVFRKPSNAAIAKADGDDLTTSNTLSFFASVPIDGWEATQTLGTNELVNTPVKAIYYSSTSAAYAANASLNFATKIKDNASAVTTGSGWVFTAPRKMDVLILLSDVSANGVTSPYASLNGNTSPGADDYFFTLETTSHGMSGAMFKSLDADDTLAIKVDGAKTIIPGKISIIELPNFSSFSVYSQPIVATVTNTTFSLTTSSYTTKIPLTIENDDSGIVNTNGDITIPLSGYYRISPYFEMNSGASVFTIGGGVFVNGTEKRVYQQASANTHSAGVGTILKLDKDDVVTFHCSTDGGGPYVLTFFGSIEYIGAVK